MNSKYIRYIIGFIMFLMIPLAFYLSKFAVFIVSVFFIIITMKEYRNMLKSKEIYPHGLLPEFIGIICAFIFTFSDEINFHPFITPILTGGIISSFILVYCSSSVDSSQ